MRLLLFCTCFLAITGCSTLYSETRDKQAQELREAHAKIDLSKQISLTRENRAKLLQLQIDTVRDLSKGQSEAIARVVVLDESPEATVESQIRMVANLVGEPSGLGKITGKTFAERRASRLERQGKYETYEKILANISVADGMRIRSIKTIEMNNYPAPSCEDILGKQIQTKNLKGMLESEQGTSKAKVSASALSLLEKHCEAYKKAVADASAIIASVPEIQVIDSRIAVSQLNLNNKVTEAAEQIVEFEKDVKAYADVAQRANADTVKQLREKAQSSLKTLASGNAFATKFVSEKKLNAIEEFLDSLSGYEGKPDSSLGKPALLLTLAAEISDIAKEAVDPIAYEWSPLLIQKKVTQAQLDGAEREIATLEQRIRLLEEVRNLTIQQVLQFAKVDTSINALSERFLTTRLAEVLGTVETKRKFTMDEKSHVQEIFGNYIDAGTRVSDKIQIAELRLSALQSETAISYAESNLNQWSALLDLNVSSLEAAGKVGITAAQINSFIDSVFLLWIGKGVN